MHEMNDTSKPCLTQIRVIEHWWDGIGNWKAWDSVWKSRNGRSHVASFRQTWSRLEWWDLPNDSQQQSRHSSRYTWWLSWCKVQHGRIWHHHSSILWVQGLQCQKCRQRITRCHPRRAYPVLCWVCQIHLRSFYKAEFWARSFRCFERISRVPKRLKQIPQEDAQADAAVQTQRSAVERKDAPCALYFAYVSRFVLLISCLLSMEIVLFNLPAAH